MNSKIAATVCNRLVCLHVLCASAVVCLSACNAARPDRGNANDPSWQPMSLDGAMKLIDDRPEWVGSYAPITIPRHPAEKHLKDVTIVLDPGHGMSDGNSFEKDPKYKRGPTGVREDDINLRVGLLLARLLNDAGANVILTRDKDMLIGLKERAEIANTVRRPDGGVGADLFISIHHNAVNNPVANYTSVWYHGQVDDAEAALDAGRYIAHRLGAAMRTDVAKTSPLFSDQLMYAGGFGVLRACEVPAILLECSFYTQPDEEQRLRSAEYNLREAYAIYEGLCEWAYGGRPTQMLPQVEFSPVGGSVLRLTTTLNEALPDWWGKDRNRILQSTIRVIANGRPVPHEFDWNSRQLVANVPVPARGEPGASVPIEVQIHFANMFKHANHPQRYLIEVQPKDWSVTIVPQRVKQARAAATRPATTQSATRPAR